MSRRKTHEEFEAEFDLVGTSSYISMVGRYINAITKITCRCEKHDTIWGIYPNKLLAGQGCAKCGIEKSSRSRALSHDEFVSRVRKMNPHLAILGRYLRRTSKIMVRCTKDDYEWSADAASLLQRSDICPCCHNLVVVSGVNDIATTHPHIAKWMRNKDDATSCHSGSNRVVDFLCPDCDHEFKRQIPAVCRNHLVCPCCGDGISFPEKFISRLLSHIGVKFNRDKSFGWSNQRRYDFYLADTNTIVECHGIQHYEKRTNRKRPFEHEQSNDIYKERLATENGIQNYFVINASVSSVNFMAHSILISGLEHLYDLSNINWNLIGEAATKSIVKQSCDMYNLGLHKTDIASRLNVDISTVYRYLRHGSKIGLCNYETKQAKIS